ncbi:MFS transporter [Nonomuraea lactucae]|uniref:MFS transporter n=1 Tax=Nonomuraea lactucae TaxID=2249762 RepID=UPI000DE4D746|nr:MFS transporter [Nonomuraea lactucae]
MTDVADNPHTLKRRALPRAAVWTGVAVLALSFMVNAMDRQLFYPLVPSIRQDYGFSLRQGGLLATGFTLGMAVSGLVAGYLTDRFSRKAILVGSIVLYSLGTMATPMAKGFGDMLAYRLVSGFGEGMQAAALFAALGAYFFHRRSLAMGGLVAAFGVGVFLGPLLGTGLAGGSESWRTPFQVFGAAGLVVAAAVWLLVRRRLTERAVDQHSDRTENVDHIPETLLNRNSIALSITSVVGGLVFYGFLGLYPSFLRSELHFTAGQAALAASMVGFGAAFSLLGGWLGDVVDQRKLLIFTYAMVSLTGLVTYLGPTTPTWQYVLAFAMGVFASGFLFTNCTSALQRAVRPERVGMAAGLFVSSYYIAAAGSGLLFATLAEAFGWRAAGFWQIGMLPLVGVVALLFVRTDQLHARGAKAAG